MKTFLRFYSLKIPVSRYQSRAPPIFKIWELSKTEILYFLAPRVEEAEFEEDEKEEMEGTGDF